MSFGGHFQHREALLRAALDEFCTHGYDSASINRILSAAGMSKGQLYHHFTGKEGLYLGLVEWTIDQKMAYLEQHPPASSDGFFETLGVHMRASLGFAAAHADIDRLSRALLAERGRPIFVEVVKRFGFDADGALGIHVEHYYAQGEFRSDLTLAFVRRLVLLVVNHAPDLLDLTKPADLAPKIDELLAFLRGGLNQA